MTEPATVFATTGRLRDQWHGMSRNGNPPPVWRPSPRCRCIRRTWSGACSEGDLVHVTSKRGSTGAGALPRAGAEPVFMAMHWGEEFLSGQSSTATGWPG